jgi:uncharacterized protein YjbI with pentapeptide repeats
MEKLNLRNENIAGSEFEDLDMSDSRFADVNLSGRTFHDINLSDAEISATDLDGTLFRHIGPPTPEPWDKSIGCVVRFEEAALTGSSFVRVNLTNVRLVDCIVEGMTIDGVPLTAMIEAYRKSSGEKPAPEKSAPERKRKS